MKLAVLGTMVVAGVLGVSGCAKKVVPLGPTPAGADSAERARADFAARAAAEAARRDSLARSAALEDSLRAVREREEREAAQAFGSTESLSAPIYFDYDRAALTEAASAVLASKLAVLRERPSLRMRISGNTDSRGADEYNLALGLRRAAVAKEFLVAGGVDPSRIEITSYGAERPAVQGENEAAWSRNRRDEFTVIGGTQE